MDEGGISGLPEIAGQSLESAVESLVAAVPSMDESTARTLLEPVTADGVISREAVQDEFATLAKVVSTPETRIELAEIALADAREAATGVPDHDIIEARLGTFETRLSAIETRVHELARDLQDLVDQDRSSDPIVVLARESHRVRNEANALQQAADELQVELESFEDWLKEPDRRISELKEDIDILAEMLERLAETNHELEDQPTTDPTDHSDTDAATLWLEAWISYRVTGLLLEDLRLEHDQLREWHQRNGYEQPALRDRLEELKDTREDIGDQLDTLGQPKWREQFTVRLSEIETTLDGFEPPVDWDEVQEALDRLWE